MAYKSQKQHLPIDENVVIPATIRAASARSDAIHKQVYEEPKQETPPVEPPVEPPATSQEPPTPPVEPPKPVTPPSQSEFAPGSVEDWERRYNAMKGRYDRQENIIASLNGRIGQMEQLLATRPPVVAPAPVVTPPELTFNPISKEEIETYGEEFVSVAERAALAKLAPQITALQQKIATLEGVTQDSNEKNERKMLADLYAELDNGQPDWRTLNRDPKFLAWANLTDQYSGATRISMLRDAFNRFDAKRVLTFFKGFLSDEAASGPVPVPRTELPSGKVPLENLAAPGRARTPAAQVAPEEKETISTAQITAFYVAVARGDYKGREEEKERLEQILFEAQRDGRVTA